MSKTYLSILIITALILIGLLVYSFLSRPEIEANEAVLVIDFGNNKRAFAGEVIDGMTIIDALGASAKIGNFNYIYQNGRLEKVDGLEQDGGHWSVFVNGTKVEEPLDKTKIEPQDKIELRFEK